MELDRRAAQFAALGNQARLRIVRLLLAAHPDGLVVGDLQSELDMPGSTLSHHLEKLKQQGLVEVRREGTFLRYTAGADAVLDVAHMAKWAPRLGRHVTLVRIGGGLHDLTLSAEPARGGTPTRPADIQK